MIIPAEAFDRKLAKVLGLRVTETPAGITLPDIDAKLYRLALNPKSKVSERFVKERGNDAIYIGGVFVESERAWRWLDDAAFRLPHLPHFAVWRDQFTR